MLNNNKKQETQFFGTKCGNANSIAAGYATETTNYGEIATGILNKSTKGDNPNSPEGVVGDPKATLFSVGCGTKEERKNALEVKGDGSVIISGKDGSAVNVVESMLTKDTVGKANGVASLDSNGSIPLSQLGNVNIEQNVEGLGIHKVYASYAAMVADASAPVGSNGKALRFGQLVAIYDSSNTTQEESGNVYAWQEGNTGAAAWLLIGNLGSVNVKVDETPTEGSTNPVQSGGVFDAISAAVASARASVSIDKNIDADNSYTLIFLQNVEKYILELTLQDSNENVFANSDVTINGVKYTTNASGIVDIELFSGTRILVISIEGYEPQSISVNMDGGKSMTLTFNEYVSPDTIILTNAVNSDIPSKYVNAPLINLMVSALSGLEYSNDPVLLDESGNPAKTITKQQAEYFTGDLYFYKKSGSTSVTSLSQLVFFSNASLVYRAFMGMSSVGGDFIFKGYIKSLANVFSGTNLSLIDLSGAKSYSDPLVIDASGAPAGITKFPTEFVILSTSMTDFGYRSAPINFDAPKLGIHSSCNSMINFFRAATKTESIKMGDCYLSSITSITNIFYNCSKLKTIEATFHADLDINVNISACPLTAESVECVLGALKPYTKDSGAHTITFSAIAKTNYNAVHEIVDTTYTSALQEAVASLGWTLG